MRKLIHGGTIVNEGQSFNGAIVIEHLSFVDYRSALNEFPHCVCVYI